MAKTIYIGDDITTSQTEVLFCERDFVNLVEEHMGRDAKNYLNLIITQRDDALEKLDEFIDEDGDY